MTSLDTGAHTRSLKVDIPLIPTCPVPNAFSQLTGSLSSDDESTLRNAICTARNNVAILEASMESLNITSDVVTVLVWFGLKTMVLVWFCMVLVRQIDKPDHRPEPDQIMKPRQALETPLMPPKGLPVIGNSSNNRLSGTMVCWFGFGLPKVKPKPKTRIDQTKTVVWFTETMVWSWFGLGFRPNQTDHYSDECVRSLEDHRKFIDERTMALSCRRLPAELWKEVFLWTMYGDDHKLDDVVFRSATWGSCPIMLTSVSRTWRNVAINTPLLWAEIDFRIRNTLPSSKLSLLEMWQHRSQSCHLRVSVILESPFVDPDVEPILPTIRQLIRMLAKQGNQWESVHLKLPEAMYLGSPFPLPPLDALQEATFETTEYILSNSDNFDFPIVRRCPQLRVLTLENFRPAFSPPLPIIPCHSIRTLICGVKGAGRFDGYCTVDELHDILKVAPSLEHLVFRIRDPGGVQKRMVKHSSLKTFEIFCGSTCVFWYLDLPALELLRIERMSNYHIFCKMNAFLRRSFSLERLCLHESHPKYLRNIDGPCWIKDLELRCSVFNDVLRDDIRFLSWLGTNVDGTALPSLRRLVFVLGFRDRLFQDDDSDRIRAILNAMASIAQRRVNKAALVDGLEEVVLRIKGNISDSTIQELNQLREKKPDGLTLETYSEWEDEESPSPYLR